MPNPFMLSASSPLCATPRCRKKKAVIGKKPDGSPKLANYCSSCRSRRWRENNPIAAAFYNLKHRAKERGHSFSITRAEFEKWCEETRYHVFKAKHKDGMSIDREREHEGYHIGNIKMMPLGENSRKMHAMRGHTVNPPMPADVAPW